LKVSAWNICNGCVDIQAAVYEPLQEHMLIYSSEIIPVRN